MLVMQDIGELVYGGAVTATEWWDNKRITDGKITSKDVLKKASFYTYLVVGLGATLMSTFGWMRRYSTWAEHVSHGFIYDLPRFSYNLYKNMSTAGAAHNANSAAVREANRVLAQRQAQLALQNARSGRETARTYEPEYNKVGVV